MVEERNENKLLSISEVAKAVGISPQAVYQQIDKKLKGYIIIDEKGKRLVRHEALKDVFNVSQDALKEEVNPLEERLNTLTIENELLKRENQNLQLDKDFLKQRIETQDKEIDNLHKRLEDAQKSLDQSQRNLDQAQQLHMAEHQEKIKLLGIESSAEGEAEVKVVVTDPEKPKQKKSLFERLFF